MSIKSVLKPVFKKIMKSPFIICCVAFAVYAYSRLTGATTRWKYLGVIQAQQALQNTNAIFVVWHSRATMMPFFQHRVLRRKMAALVSPHQDGQIIAHLLKWFHITPVNGSSNENPRQSALELMRALIHGYDLCISPDGPRGPRMRMKKSPIYFASKTGKPIVCACYSSKPCKIASTSWDRTLIPLPFAKGVFALSNPIYVPEGLDDDGVETYRQKLERIANLQTQECDALAGNPVIEPADINDFKKKEG